MKLWSPFGFQRCRKSSIRATVGIWELEVRQASTCCSRRPALSRMQSPSCSPRQNTTVRNANVTADGDTPRHADHERVPSNFLTLRSLLTHDLLVMCHWQSWPDFYPTLFPRLDRAASRTR